VRERVLEAIQSKVEGQEITSTEAEPEETKIIDLMDALKASLAKRGSGTDEKTATKRATGESEEMEEEPPAKKRRAVGRG
jgi:DNA end-binding protein Ku